MESDFDDIEEPKDWEEFVKKVNNKSGGVNYICDCNRSLQRFVFLPTGDFWYLWNIFILLFATIDFILYPYYTAQGFPDFHYYDPGWLLILISSMVFLIDLILNFFVAQTVEGDEADYVIHIEKIGLKYL